MSKMWRSQIFEKNFFGRKCRKYAGKPVFWPFLEILSLVFFRFFAQRCVLTMPKMWPSRVFEKNFFPAENAGNMPEIAVFADFVWIFSSNFVVFSQKNIINSNTHYQACFNYQKNWFSKPELSKNRRNSQFSPEKEYFLNISIFTWYFFMKFCTLTQNDNVQNVMEPDFWKKYFSCLLYTSDAADE